jgi:uncharacterized membrane-anchored protein YhcB (DUF1043 family)
MENDPSQVEISVNELKLLTSTLSKSVALSLKKRFAWLWLLAGLLAGVIITLLIVTMAWKNTDNISTTSKSLLKQTEDISTTSKSLLKQTDVVLSDLQKIHSDLNTLTVSVNALNQKARADSVPPLSPDRKPMESKLPQNNVYDLKYRVYLHYSDLKNIQIMKDFSVFLKEKGFEVLGIQRIRYQHQDIRFFHNHDKKVAEMLKQYLSQFISSVNDIKKKPIRVIDLSRKYPKAQKGLLEVWVDF